MHYFQPENIWITHKKGEYILPSNIQIKKYFKQNLKAQNLSTRHQKLGVHYIMFYALYYIPNTDTHCVTKTLDKSETLKHNDDG